MKGNGMINEKQNYDNMVEFSNSNQNFSKLEPASISEETKNKIIENLKKTKHSYIKNENETELAISESIENYDQIQINKEKKQKNLKEREENKIDSFVDFDSHLLHLGKLINKEDNNLSITNTNELTILQSNIQRHFSMNQINFNVLITGESSSGKTLFLLNFLKKIQKLKKNSQKSDNSDEYIDCLDEKENEILTQNIKIGEPTKKFDYYRPKNLSHNNYFTFIDSPGYMDTLGSQKWLNTILEFIHSKNVEYQSLKKETGYSDKKNDCRIHLILYFIMGPKPRMIDYLNIKELQNVGNIIPIIGRGEGLNKEIIEKIKDEIIDYGRKYEINYFDVKKSLKKLSLKEANLNFFTSGAFGLCPPYFIQYGIHKDDLYYENNNVDESDFLRLYYLILGYLPFDCIDRTKKILYEQFKTEIANVKEKKSSIERFNKKYFYSLLAIPLAISVFSLFSKSKSR